MARKWDPEIGQFRDSGRFGGNDNVAAAGGLDALAPAQAAPATKSLSQRDYSDKFDTGAGGRYLVPRPEDHQADPAPALLSNFDPNKPHKCRDFAPESTLPGAVWRCPCGHHYKSCGKAGTSNAQWGKASRFTVSRARRKHKKQLREIYGGDLGKNVTGDPKELIPTLTIPEELWSKKRNFNDPFDSGAGGRYLVPRDIDRRLNPPPALSGDFRASDDTPHRCKNFQPVSLPGAVWQCPCGRHFKSYGQARSEYPKWEKAGRLTVALARGKHKRLQRKF